MNYSVDYFINKFESIPDERWTTMNLIDSEGRSCAMGHCGARPKGNTTPESESLRFLMYSLGLGVFAVNDGRDGRFNQPTPKARILAALRDFK